MGSGIEGLTPRVIFEENPAILLNGTQYACNDHTTVFSDSIDYDIANTFVHDFTSCAESVEDCENLGIFHQIKALILLSESWDKDEFPSERAATIICDSIFNKK